jgi:queuine tRNA-ribosyltransferase
MQFRVTHESGGPRAGELDTARNRIATPAFMPVGTHGAVNGLLPEVLVALGAEVLVCNAFRLADEPGEAVLRAHGGLHKFMAWPRAILTDSGGFQVYRVKDRVVREDGVAFYQGKKGQVVWTPELAVEVQATIGSDLVMPLDVCVSLPATRAEAEAAMERTLRWAERAQRAGKLRAQQTLFGIVQGATFADLRQRSVAGLEALGFAAYAIGGLNVGETAGEFRATLTATARLLPRDKPRYLMGVGRPEAMLDAVAAGVDLMDSIIPTKYAREGSVFTRRGPLNLQKPKYARDKFPIDPNCRCYTCANVSRGYLHHLYATTMTTAQVFAAIHNVGFCLGLLREARQAIVDGKFAEYRADFERQYSRRGAEIEASS